MAVLFQTPSDFYSIKAGRHCLFSIGKLTTPSYNFGLKIFSYVIESDLREPF